MTQEDKDLLLKDLSARVPYGVKYMKYSWGYDLDQEIPEVEVLECIDKNGYINYTKVYMINDIKPYLFPFESMSEEQRKEYESLCIKEASNCTDLYDIVFTKDYFYNTVESIDYLYKNHIDIRGFIPMGLALDATGKNIY